MDDIKQDLRAIRTDVAEIRVNVAVNTESLKSHMERTRLNESRLEKLEYLLIGLAVAAVLGGLIRLFIS